MYGKIGDYELDWCDCVILAWEMTMMVGNQSGMVLAWDKIMYSWVGKNEIVWTQHGMWMRMDHRGWYGILNAMNNIVWLLEYVWYEVNK